MIDLSEKSQKVLFFVVLFAPREIWNPSFARPIKLWNDAKKRRTQTSHAEKLACWLVPHLMHSYSYPSKNRTFLITFHLQKSVGEILESPIRGHTCWHLHRPHLFTWTVLHVAIQAAEFFLGFFRNKFWSTKKNTGTPPNGPPIKKKHQGTGSSPPWRYARSWGLKFAEKGQNVKRFGKKDVVCGCNTKVTESRSHAVWTLCTSYIPDSTRCVIKCVCVFPSRRLSRKTVVPEKLEFFGLKLSQL